jgi:hypothetical protein
MISQLRTIRARDTYRPDGTHMDVQPAKILREFFSPLGTYVLENLIAEDAYTSLRDKQRKFVFLSVR